MEYLFQFRKYLGENLKSTPLAELPGQCAERRTTKFKPKNLYKKSMTNCMSLITVLRIRSNSPHFCWIGIIFVGFGSFLLDLVHFCWIYIIFFGFASFCWNCINFVEFHIIEYRFGSDPNLTKESPHCSYVGRNLVSVPVSFIFKRTFKNIYYPHSILVTFYEKCTCTQILYMYMEQHFSNEIH